MYNVTALVTLAEDISPIMNLLAILAQAIATIGLFVVTYFLWKATSELRNYAKDQTDILGKQAGYAEKQNDIMDKQITILEDQKEIMDSEVIAMKEDRKYRLLVEKYKRLRDEMDNLVAPLYVHAFGYTDENPGHFTVFHVGELEKLYNQYKERSVFWNNILKNLHLSQSKDLSEYLGRHFKYNLDHASSKSGKDAQRVRDNAPELIKRINNRYLQLNAELESLEIELGIRKTK